MSLTIDPQAYEIRALRRAANWRNQHVIEIGCGSGRLTLRLADLGAARVEALDPDKGLIREARKNLPQSYADRIRYNVGHAENLKSPAHKFDLAVFSWVL